MKSKSVAADPVTLLVATVGLLALVSVAFVSAARADPVKFVRYPHSHGDRLTFSYQGDIWVANADGSDARRLTAHITRGERIARLRTIPLPYSAGGEGGTGGA